LIDSFIHSFVHSFILISGSYVLLNSALPTEMATMLASSLRHSDSSIWPLHESEEQLHSFDNVTSCDTQVREPPFKYHHHNIFHASAAMEHLPPDVAAFMKFLASTKVRYLLFQPEHWVSP